METETENITISKIEYIDTITNLEAEKEILKEKLFFLESKVESKKHMTYEDKEKIHREIQNDRIKNMKLINFRDKLRVISARKKYYKNLDELLKLIIKNG